MMRRSVMSFRPVGRRVQIQAVMARQFSTAPGHGSKQPSVGRQPAVLPLSEVKVKAAPLVPEITAEQKEASAAVRTAQQAAAAASNHAERVSTEAAVLKKLYEEYALKKIDADQDAKASQQAVVAAVAAKKSADESAVVMIENTRKQDKKFLENAFIHFDTDKKGLMSVSQLSALLADCKLPSNGEDTDLLDGIRDKHGWAAHMPADLKAALANHPQAGEWAK